MTRFVVLTDVHANLPALEAVIAEVEKRGYDLLVHTGDAIGIGPFPAECVDRLCSLQNCHLLMGNHDEWFAYGLPDPQPAWMSEGEVTHHLWTHEQIHPARKKIVAVWQYQMSCVIDSVMFSFLHYPRNADGNFIEIIREPSVADLDAAFAAHSGDLIFYGHHHPSSDWKGKHRYINPGSLGCSPTAYARYCVVECQNGTCKVDHRSVGYDDSLLFKTFEERAVPERRLLYKYFFGNRFGG